MICFQASESNFFRTERSSHLMLYLMWKSLKAFFFPFSGWRGNHFQELSAQKGDWICYASKAFTTEARGKVSCVSRRKKDHWAFRASLGLPVWLNTATESAPEEASASRRESPTRRTGQPLVWPHAVSVVSGGVGSGTERPGRKSVQMRPGRRSPRSRLCQSWEGGRWGGCRFQHADTAEPHRFSKLKSDIL